LLDGIIHEYVPLQGKEKIMTTQADLVSHPGVIHSIDEQKLKVLVISVSACGACKVKGSCSMAEMEEKIVDAQADSNESFQVGDQVTVSMRQSHGNLAVFLGYGLPFILLMVTLVCCVAAGLGQGQAGLVSVGILVPYYLLLYYFRNSLTKTFRFYVRHADHLSAHNNSL